MGFRVDELFMRQLRTHLLTAASVHPNNVFNGVGYPNLRRLNILKRAASPLAASEAGRPGNGFTRGNNRPSQPIFICHGVVKRQIPLVVGRLSITEHAPLRKLSYLFRYLYSLL
jgi:hypothetical protein